MATQADIQCCETHNISAHQEYGQICGTCGFNIMESELVSLTTEQLARKVIEYHHASQLRQDAENIVKNNLQQGEN